MLDLRIILHTPTHIVGIFKDEGGQHRTGVVSVADFDWISSDCQLLWERRRPHVPSLLIDGVPLEGPDANQYLCTVLGSDVESIISGATARSWDAKMPPMPQQTSIFYLSTTFSPFNSWLIARGFVPKQMEEKWFVYYEASRLYFRRSWTGILIYEVAAQWRDDQLYLGHVIVNRCPNEYFETDDDYDKRILQFLVEAILLGLPAKFPLKPELTAEEGAIQAWSSAGNSSL